MKKTIVVICLLIVPFAMFGQLVRSGALSSETWNQNVHITGNATIGNGVTIIITPGITVSLDPAVNLTVSGTGTLWADASSGSSILFTANDGNSWGHLIFTNSTATVTSRLYNCIIEKGDARLLNPSYGGGIYVTSNKLDIQNCTIRNNKAALGGGIHVGIGFSISIMNSVITSNFATQGGGAIHLYAQNSSTVQNCLITSNSVDLVTGDYSGGGVLLGFNCGSAKIINCVFAGNTSKPGTDVTFYGSNSLPKFTNCILWSTNPIRYANQSANAGDFTNCAILGSVAANYTSCINLNATNTAIDGPNFSNPASSDYSLRFVSPCRDAGTWANAPSTDILGKFRVAVPDIGAYEIQYSSWTGAIDNSWTNTTNWESSIDPSSGSGDVIIPFNSMHIYPVSAATNFTIGPGKVMILKPGAEATFGTLVNNGTLSLESSVSGISSIIFSSYSGNPASIQLYLDGGGSSGTYKWHYISSPVTSLPVSTFTGTTKNIAKYYENRITTDQNVGWVAYDGWIYLPTGTMGGPTFSTLDPGIGYNHYFTAPHTYTFTGTFNSSDVTINLAYNSAGSSPDYPNSEGFNLLGNPFPSCLDWAQIFPTLPQSLSQAIYFNKNGGVASWNNGVGTNGGTGIIPPMQGFFMKAYGAGASVTLPASARVHNPTQARYKRTLEVISLVRLKIEDALNSDDAVVRFDNQATTGVDNAFDAYKFSKTGSTVGVWTTTGGADLSINAIPFPTTTVDIPVSFYTSEAGTFKISGPQIDGLENYKVTLTDLTNNSITDLTTTSFISFSAPGGIITNRFVLNVSTITTALPKEIITPGNAAFNIYQGKENLNIQPLGDDWNGIRADVRILDLSGRLVQTEKNIDFNKGAINQIPVSLQNGLYFVEIRSGIRRYVGKVVFK